MSSSYPEPTTTTPTETCLRACRDQCRVPTVVCRVTSGVWRARAGTREDSMLREPRVIVVREGERLRDAGSQTAGMFREMAFTAEDLWVGVVTTAPGDMSAWHHHGDHDTYAYVTSGLKRIEYGPGGEQSILAQPGDFIHVPSGVVHREGNPAGDVSRS